MKIDKLEKEFGRRVANARNRHELTQVQLAKKAKISRATLANIETGHQRTMLITAIKLRKLIGVLL